MKDYKWEYTADFDEAEQWLRDLEENHSIASFDFEAASKYTEIEKEKLKKTIDYAPKWKRIALQQKIDSDGLSHPALTTVTHLSFATSRTEGKCIILTGDLRTAVLDWLVTTDITQIWHNASFDFRHIRFNTGKIPKHYEDTQILAKTLLNHVDVFKAKSGLKDLMYHEFGDWALSDLQFSLENVFDERMLKYACIDASACWGLAEDIYNDLGRTLQ